MFSLNQINKYVDQLLCSSLSNLKRTAESRIKLYHNTGIYHFNVALLLLPLDSTKDLVVKTWHLTYAALQIFVLIMLLYKIKKYDH